MPSLIQYCVSIAICLAVASCSPIVDLRGHSEEQADYSQIIIGQSTADDVQAILGTPSSKSNYGDPTWFYITEKRETRGMLAPEVIDQAVTAVTFDASGYVESIEKGDNKDIKRVEYVEKETPTEGRKMSIMEQLMGNLGKFNAPGKEIDPRNLGR